MSKAEGGWIEERTSGLTGERMYGRMSEQTNLRMDGWMDGWVAVWMDGWMDGRAGGRPSDGRFEWETTCLIRG